MSFSIWSRLLVFILGGLGIVYVSRASFRSPLTHGFPRFVAWITILALFCLNVESWFRAPWSVNQIFSWIFLIVGAGLIIVGVFTLRSYGEQDSNRHGEDLYTFEKTSALVTKGIYHYIRHPFYSSLLFLGWGICLKVISWPSVLFGLVVSASLIFTAIIEEREDINFFGAAYQDYMKTTKRFVPFLY